MAGKTWKKWKDRLLIWAIRRGGRLRNTAWQYMYQSWRGYYLAGVLRKGGTAEEADGVMAKVYEDVEKQILTEGFENRVNNLRAYFAKAVSREWVRYAGQKGKLPPEFAKEADNRKETSVEENYITGEEMKILKALLEKLGDKCKIVLSRYAQGYSMEEIATEAGYENVQSAKNKRRECLEKLVELAQNTILRDRIKKKKK